MRAYGISVGILAAILVFSLWNSSYMTASTVRWREQLQQADAQAQSEAWTEAVDTLAGSYDDWSESQTYLHIVARHDTVDDAEAMYRRALAFAATRELTEFRAEISDLRDQLRLLAETERLDMDGLFIAVGQTPQSAPFQEAVAVENGYYLAGEDTKTSLLGVFAAGDGRKKQVRQLTTAVSDGAAAALAACHYLEEQGKSE